MTCFLAFPQQLFDPSQFYVDADRMILIEEPIFFGDYHYNQKMHQQKILLHRASMKYFADKLIDHDKKVEYWDYAARNILDDVFASLQTQKINTVHIYEVVDETLMKRLTHAAQKYSVAIEWHLTPMFLNTKEQNEAYRSQKKRWFMADFYKFQRRRLKVLIDENDEPVGGSWSFDEENRKKLPKKMVSELPSIKRQDTENLAIEKKYIEAATSYVNQNFSRHPGSITSVIYPISQAGAEKWFEQFLQERFADFGPYEDAIVEDQNWLYHSILTPMMNVGLLTPMYVVTAAIEYSETHDIPINSLEGFVRQIIGWREFMRATYQDLGTQMRNGNHWQHKRKIPVSFYDGTTGIDPVDDAIKRINQYGYCHHIERLMVLGGIMFLCEFDPREIYRWFMEMFVDSYDWVMVTNVFAMSQHSCGGLITTKPYFSGSNYVRKMSHYPKGDWCDTWDGLYWNFIIKHTPALKKNPRWAMMCRLAEKMDESKRQKHQLLARTFLARL